MNLPSTREVIQKLKEVRNEKGYSYTDIENLMAKNGDSLSRSTISSVFTDGSEDDNFDYEYTIRPIAKALLDIETIEDTDELDVQAMKMLLKLKMEKIQEVEAALNKEKVKHNERVDQIREQYNKRVDFLMNQIELKDKRIDFLLDANQKKDELNLKMTEQILNCPYRKEAQ